MSEDAGDTIGAAALDPEAATKAAGRRGHSGQMLPAIGRAWLVPAGLAAAFGAWQLVSVLAGSSAVSHEPLVPSAVDIARSFKTLAYYGKGGLGIKAASQGGPINATAALLALAQNTLPTVARLVAGFTIGIAMSALLCAVVSWSRLLRQAFALTAHGARMLPLLALFPLFAIWFGNSETGAVLFVAFGTFAIVFIAALTAIDSVPGYYFEYARTLGAGRLRAYCTVVLPAALPNMRGGIMLAIGFGWSMVIAAEAIGQTVGLGAMTNLAVVAGKTSTLAVVAVAVVILAGLSVVLVSRGFDYLVRWAE